MVTAWRGLPRIEVPIRSHAGTPASAGCVGSAAWFSTGSHGAVILGSSEEEQPATDSKMRTHGQRMGCSRARGSSGRSDRAEKGEQKLEPGATPAGRYDGADRAPANTAWRALHDPHAGGSDIRMQRRAGGGVAG